MRQFKNNLKRNRGRNHSDRPFKRGSDIDRLNGNFANNDNSLSSQLVNQLVSELEDVLSVLKKD